MEKYLVAKHHIARPGRQTLTPGEVLPDDLLYELDDAQIERLLRIGAVEARGGPGGETVAPKHKVENAPPMDSRPHIREVPDGPEGVHPDAAESLTQADLLEDPEAEEPEAEETDGEEAAASMEPVELDATAAIVPTQTGGATGKARQGKRGERK